MILLKGTTTFDSMHSNICSYITFQSIVTTIGWFTLLQVGLV